MRKHSLFLQMVMTTGLVAFISIAAKSTLSSPELLDDPSVQSIESSLDATFDSVLEGGQLEVRPAIGEPTPLKLNLQGAESTQRAESGLQQQGGSSLQPNAGLTEFPEEGTISQ